MARVEKLPIPYYQSGLMGWALQESGLLEGFAVQAPRYAGLATDSLQIIDRVIAIAGSKSAALLCHLRSLVGFDEFLSDLLRRALGFGFAWVLRAHRHEPVLFS